MRDESGAALCEALVVRGEFMSDVNHDLYAVIMRCLQSSAYAGGAFQEKAFQWLDESQALSQAEREAGWFKLHDEYEALSAPHWESVWKNLDDRKYVGLKQGELFNV